MRRECEVATGVLVESSPPKSSLVFDGFFSILLSRSVLSMGQVLGDALSTPHAKTTEFSWSEIIHQSESAAFTVLFVSGRSRSSVSSLVMIGSSRRGLCGVGIVPLRLNGHSSDNEFFRV